MQQLKPESAKRGGLRDSKRFVTSSLYSSRNSSKGFFGDYDGATYTKGTCKIAKNMYILLHRNRTDRVHKIGRVNIQTDYTGQCIHIHKMVTDEYHVPTCFAIDGFFRAKYRSSIFRTAQRPKEAHTKTVHKS